MTQVALLDYLKKYVADPKIISINQLSEIDKKSFPESWIDILSVEDDERTSTTLSYWSNFKKEFEQVVEYLESNLISVDLIHHGFGFCLLYGIKSADGSRILYYEGRNPNTKIINPSVMGVWKKMPDKLQDFYNQLHNGWYYLASGAMGLSPVEDYFFLEEEDWSIVEEFEELPIKLDHTLALYSNGMGGYVCLEFKENSCNCLLWWKSKAPNLKLDFWPLIDSWTVMGFEV